MRNVLESRLADNRLVTYMIVNTLVTAIFDAARQISGQGGGDNTRKALDNLKNRLLPEIKEGDERSAADIEAMLKKESEGGPMKVQRLDYESTRKKSPKVLK